MASFTQNVSPTFPPGTTLKAYKRSNFSSANPPVPGQAPVGAADATAVTDANGAVSFIGLADATPYVITDAGGSRYLSFVTPRVTASSGPGAHAGTLKVFGHSFADVVGTGTSLRRNRWAGRVAALLGLNEENYARNSSYVGINNIDEITTRVMQLVVPATTSARSYSGEYQAPSQVAVVFGGVNDAAVQAIVTNSYKAITEGIRTCCCRLRQAASFEESHASVVLAQGAGATGWTTGVASKLMSGSTLAQETANGNTFTITVPSYFPGGEIDIYMLVPAGGGCVWTITLDGAAQASFDTRGAGGTNEPRVYRLQGVSAGTHTIVGTVTNRQGSGDYLDSWGWAAPIPGLVMVPNIPRAPSYPFVDHVTTDAEITTINGLIAGVVATFDSRVALVDVDSAFQNAGTALANLFFTDNIHPNDAGHTVLTQAFYNAAAANWPQTATLAAAQAPGIDAQQSLRVMEQASTTGAKDARMGVATLAAGTVTVTNRIVTATSRIYLSRVTPGAAPGHLSYTISAGASFTITSSSGTDTGTVNWMIVEPG